MGYWQIKLALAKLDALSPFNPLSEMRVSQADFVRDVTDVY